MSIKSRAEGPDIARPLFRPFVKPRAVAFSFFPRRGPASHSGGYATNHDQLPRRHFFLVSLGDPGLERTARTIPRSCRLPVEGRADGQDRAAADPRRHGMVLPAQRNVDAFPADVARRLG